MFISKGYAAIVNRYHQPGRLPFSDFFFFHRFIAHWEVGLSSEAKGDAG